MIINHHNQYRYLKPFLLFTASSNEIPSNLAASSIRSRPGPSINFFSSISIWLFSLINIVRITTPKTVEKRRLHNAMTIDCWYLGPHEAFQTYEPIILPRFPNPLTRPIATERFAGGRGMAFETQANVKANPQYPVVMRNKEKYRPPVAMVQSEMMYPTMTTHHQLAIWKNRSPVLSACHALSTQQADANTHGGAAIKNVIVLS